MYIIRDIASRPPSPVISEYALPTPCRACCSVPGLVPWDIPSAGIRSGSLDLRESADSPSAGRTRVTLPTLLRPLEAAARVPSECAACGAVGWGCVKASECEVRNHLPISPFPCKVRALFAGLLIYISLLSSTMDDTCPVQHRVRHDSGFL